MLLKSDIKFNVFFRFLKSYLHYQFADAFVEQDTSPFPINYPLASDKESMYIIVIKI